MSLEPNGGSYPSLAAFRPYLQRSTGPGVQDKIPVETKVEERRLLGWLPRFARRHRARVGERSKYILIYPPKSSAEPLIKGITLGWSPLLPPSPPLPLDHHGIFRVVVTILVGCEPPRPGHEGGRGFGKESIGERRTCPDCLDFVRTLSRNISVNTRRARETIVEIGSPRAFQRNLGRRSRRNKSS